MGHRADPVPFGPIGCTEASVDHPEREEAQGSLPNDLAHGQASLRRVNRLRIAYLEIRNFRGVRNAKIRLGQHNVFVGPNNAGKTTIMEALALLFGRDRLLRSLTEYDFFGGDPKPDDRIQLIATIVGFTPNDSNEHPEWFRMDRGVPKWLDKATGELHASADDPKWQLACQVCYCARFDRQLLEVASLRYFYHDDEAADPFLDESSLSHFPSQLVRELGFFLVPASRTWDRILSFGSELFKRVVTSLGGKPSESVLLARDELRAPGKPLEADSGLKNLVDDLNNELSGFFLDEPKLHLRVTTTDSEGVLDAVVPHYGVPDEPLVLPARRHGNGLISLQWLLLLLQLGRKRAEEGMTFLMALEEPELHVPPPLQRRLVHRIQALSAQTFVSTHSPVVAALADPRTLCLLHNANGALSAVPLHVKTPHDKTPSAIRSLFYSRRLDTISALMHDAILIPEGHTDFLLLHLLIHAVEIGEGWKSKDDSHFGSYVGIIPTHDAALTATATTLLPLHPRISAIVDGDSAGIGYVTDLAALSNPGLVAVARWCNGWTIEDVIGWILMPVEAAAVAHLADCIQPSPTSVGDLVSRLKSPDRANGGLKQDQMAYESVANAIACIEDARVRARDLLNALADVALGRTSAKFASEPGSDPRVKAFVP